MAIINDYRINRIFALAWIIIIFLLSAQSYLPVPHVFSAQDKLEHLVVFGILGVLLGRSFKPDKKPISFKRIILLTIIVTAYGALDETHQMFVPNRCASIGDLLADSLGGFLGGVLLYYLPMLQITPPRHYSE